MTSTDTRPASRARSTLAITAGVIAALVVVFFIFASLFTDWLWYEQLGFTNVLTTGWIAGSVMFIIGFLAMAVPVYLSISLAFRARPVYAKLNAQLDRYQQVIEPLRRLAMIGIPAVLGLFAGVASSSRWPVALQWLNRTPSGETDPQFGLDVSFYLFELPFYQSVAGFASAVVLISAIAALATCYLYGALRFNGREVRISKQARIQLSITAAVYLLIQAFSIWLDQYATLSQNGSGLLVGASYADANAVIPGRQILAIAAALVAVLFIVTAIIGRWRLPIIGTALLLISGLLVGTVYPFIVQNFQVNPSARSLEAEYIDRNIEGTREAYGVADVVEEDFTPSTDTAAGALRGDAETTANIRIIDPALVTRTFAQLEQFRQYYQFPDDLDVDRYEIDGQVQDTVIAARELDLEGLGSANNFYNRTFVYTHGYGVVAAYGNQRSPEGLPVFLQSGIPSEGALGTDYEPRIYFGESSPEFSIVGAPEGTRPVELDYPSAEDEEAQNTTTTYAGNGGPTIDNVFKKLLYAIKFQSEEIFLSDAVNDESQILYDRDPRERVQKVAPYLTLDSDAYPAVVDNKVLWIVDGYTTSANYPYSDIQQLSNAIVDTYTPAPAYAIDNINYIRNSVKATVDAYSGEVVLYAWDEEDPVLQTWQKIYPSTVVPMTEMSGELLSHVRYPADLFKVQRAILSTYHVTDTDSFYSNDDAWITPNDPTQSAATAQFQPPYYLTMQVPGAEEPDFSLYTTYIPDAEGEGTRNVLTGYMAVNANAGSTAGEVAENYGQFTLLTLPRQETVPGPGQVQNDFNTDTEVANQLALLTRGDTEVRRGNLLTLPVGGGLLYVQPVYVQSTAETSFPILRKVLVSFGNQIAFEDTLDAALDSLFAGDSGAVAGDGGVPTVPDDTEVPDGTEEPAEDTPDADVPADVPADAPTQSTGNAVLDAALADAQQALSDRADAYATNDLVGAAEADQRLQTAIEQALAASE
ncbi:UPF0182 family membrane protein [Marisediminicola senii]|uniref:UPF0182 family membrane protein n=1 Tax=Marisediminicola senii TaxID=2711233 RepID=UPI0013ECE848|nr:UPF0182 family protein [Marisediminicola senii]